MYQMRFSDCQTIQTKYLPPTNTKGARIRATASGGNTVTIPYYDGETTKTAHKLGALALADEMGWDGQWIAGDTKDGYVFVLIDGEKTNENRL